MGEVMIEAKRLRDLASAKHDDLSVASEAADLIDQQAAEIAELTELVEAQKQEILELHDIRDQRDEWRRRASWIWLKLKTWGNNPERMYTEAAQWFEEN